MACLKIQCLLHDVGKGIKNSGLELIKLLKIRRSSCFIGYLKEKKPMNLLYSELLLQEEEKKTFQCDTSTSAVVIFFIVLGEGGKVLSVGDLCVQSC